MQNWIVACIVALAVVYLAQRFRRSLRQARTPDCGCKGGCAGCQVTSNCNTTASELKDE